MIVCGIDPGPTESAWAEWDGEMILSKGIIPNEKMLGLMKIKMFCPHATIAIEGIQGYGKVVGRDVFQTIIMIGRILQAAEISVDDEKDHILYRPAIKGFLCGSARAKDKDIRARLIEFLGENVTKGVSNHVWSALAVAWVYYQKFTSAANLKKRKIS